MVWQVDPSTGRVVDGPMPTGATTKVLALVDGVTREVYVSTGTGGGFIPTATWAEDAQADDSLTIRTAFAEDATVDDALTVRAALAEDATVDDVFAAIVQANWAEDAQVNDLVKLTLTDVIAGRTATPDTDLMGDGWTDQANTAVTHGNEPLQINGKSTVGSDERRAHLFLDLSQFANWAAGGTGLVLTLTASNSSVLLGETVNWAAQDFAARPFTESTLTWANQPTNSGSRGTGTLAVPASAVNITVTLTINPTNLAACLGRWLLITFTGNSAAAPPAITLQSRDVATVASRPRFTVNYVQRGT